MTGSESYLDQVRKDMDEFLARKGIILIDHKPDVEAYLNITHEEMASLPPEELGQMGFALARYAYYVQGVINGFIARANICKKQIERIIAPKAHKYAGASREDRRMAAILDNEEAVGWLDLLEKAEQAIDMLSYMPQRIQDMSKAALETQRKQWRSYGKI